MQDMPKPIRVWTARHCTAEAWRVTAWCDEDDLMQEAHIIWGIICDRYPNVDPPQRTALFKRSLKNRITDLSRKVTRQNHVSVCQLMLPSDMEEADAWDRVMGGESEVATFMCTLRDAPQMIREALALYLDDTALDLLRRPYARRPDGTRETLSERMCLLLGAGTPKDIPDQLRAFLRGL